MAQQSPPNKQRITAILNIIAGILFLVASFNLFGATPGPGWIWLVFAALFVIMGVWGLRR